MEAQQIKALFESNLDKALVSRGKNKGQLKAKCPPIDTPEAAIWQAITSHANPYKVGFGHVLFMSDKNKALFNAVYGAIEDKKIDVRAFDRDRVALELAGVW